MMLTDCPDPKEVSDFHFLQLRTLRVTKDHETIPSKAVNIVASASKYGLLFIGLQGGFKVIKLEDILTLDEDKENRSIEGNYPFCFIPCETPTVLAVNASQTILAVCMKNASGTFIHLYYVASFPSSEEVWRPFCSQLLSSAGIDVRDFLWNPALERLYTFCLSDGSLHLHDCSGTSIKAVASLSGANAMSVCWSPKGKQLVVGKQDGSFTQYKPTLETVTNVKPPALDASPISVASICWISNTVFAVVYVADDSPNLFMVNTPKGSPVTYTNFNDICLGNNSTPDQKYLFHLESSWGILICASLDSIEIAVLGDMPNWVQWDLREDGKALLPGKNGAHHPVGMTVMYSAQRQIIISESESYPPMPVLFFLTDNGLLVSFHMINSKSGAPTLVSSPLPLEIKRNAENDAPQVIGRLPSLQSQPPVSTSFVARPNASDHPTSVLSITKHQNTAPRIETSLTFSHSEQLKESPNISGNQLFLQNSNKVETIKGNSDTENIDKSQQKINSLHFTPGKENIIQTNTDNSYRTAIISEMQTFEKELQDLKNLQNSVSIISGEKDMTSLKVFSLSLHNFQKDMTEIMHSLSSDIYMLKNVLLESFVMVEEACSRERRKNDHSYITMLKERSLDPITAKRMQKINQHYLYLSTQLREVSDKLDQDWIHLMSAKRAGIRKNSCISSTEAVYKTIVSNQNIIHNLRLNMNILLKKADEKKLRSTSKSGNWGNYHKRSTQEDLSKLADEFLQVKIANKEEEPSVAKKLSRESQKCLRDYLKLSSVITVRPTAVYCPSQSRLLSNAVPSEDLSGSDQTQDNSDKLVSATPASKEEICEKTGSIIEKPSNNTLLCKENSVKPVTQSYAPVCEPVSPPEATPPQSVNKTFTGAAVSKEIFPELRSQQQIVSASNDSPSFQLSKQKSSIIHQEVTSGVKSGQNNKELSYFSPPSSSKSFFAASSETAFSASSPSNVLQTFSFSSNVKVTVPETTVPKTVTISSSSVPLPLSSSSFGQKIDVPKPSSATVTFAAPLPVQSESSCLTEGEKQNLVQQKPPFEPLLNTTFSAAPSLGNSVKLLVPKTPQAPSPVVIPPQNKTLQDISNEKVHPNTSQSVRVAGFFSEKLPNNDKPFERGMGDNATISDFSSCENSSFVANSLSKMTFVDSKQQENKSVVTESQSSRPLKDSNISSSQELLDAIERTENLTYDATEPDKNNSPVLSDPKQSLSSSDILSAKPTNPPTSTLPIIVSFTSVAPQPANSAAVVTSVVTSVLSTISQSNVTVAQPLSSTLPTVSSQPSTAQPSLFEQKSPELSSEALKNDSSSFGIKSPPVFGQSAPGTSFFPTPKTDVPVFSEASAVQPLSFGQPTTTTSNFTSPPSGFFSQTQSFGTPDEASVSTPSDFSSQSSSFSFAKPAFGQTTGSFGLAKSFFGQNASSSFTQPTGTTSSFGSFGQNNSGNSIFGQGSFFSGLGGKPSEENASKNVFGMSSAVKSPDTSNLFRNSSVTSFGAVGNNSFGGGSFSAGGGSVAQSGFGSFQQSPIQQQQQQQQQPGGFGAAPAFGSPPPFGSPPAFGASPSFGSSPVFGQQQLQISSTFSNFANASSPTFGSLASQTSGFGSPQATGFGSSQSFGSPPSFGSTSFGGGQPSSFGSPGSPPSNSSAFTQWRN